MSESSNPTLNNSPLGCLFCKVDKRVSDPDVRAFVYMCISQMVEQTMKGMSWQDYTDCCRRHAMLSVKGMCELGETMISLLDESASVLGLSTFSARAASNTRQLLTKLEMAVMDKYDSLEEERTKKP